MTAPLPSKIGRFRILRRLGAGGMGVVYEGVDDLLGRRAAVKVLKEGTDDAIARQRFLREARAAAAVSHDNVGTIYEVGEDGETLFLAMEFVDGRTLREQAHAAPPDIARTLEIASEIASALAAAHRAGLVHRDLKPDNVMIERATGRAKVLDFGLAKRAGDSDRSALELAERATVPPDTPDSALLGELTAAGTILGSPGYMSPEQLQRADVDARTDVWAFGVLLFELLAGRRPFDAPHGPGLVLAVCTAPTPPIPRDDVPTALSALVSRCLEKEPDARPADGAALLRALASIEGRGPAPEHEDLGVAPTIAATPAPAEVAVVTAPAPERPAWVLPLAVALAVTSLGAMLYVALREAPERPPPEVASTEPSPSGPAANEEDPPRRQPRPTICEHAEPPCSGGSVGWCDRDGSRVACCGAGLLPEEDGVCGCPPGGATEETALANGCAAPAEGDYAEALQATLRLGVGPIRECYSRYLEQGRGVQGRVLTAFDVNPWGELENVRLDESSLPSPDVQRCVLRVVRELEVPPPPGGQTLPVSYPFTFTTD